MSTPKARTIVALLAALLVVAVAYFAAIAVAAGKAETPEPHITAYAHGKSVTVEPFMYCTVHVENNALEMRDCSDSQFVASLDVPPGYPLQLSLPKEISDAPWRMVLVYVLPDGSAVQQVKMYNDEEFSTKARAITVPTPDDPRLQLAVVEIQLPVPARDENGNEGYVPSAVWSVQNVS